MEPTSFAAAVAAQSTPTANNLIFPDKYHKSFFTASNECPFIRKIGRRNGKPAFLIADSEVSALTEPFRFTLVGKFGSRPPRLESIKQHFVHLKLKGKWTIGFLDSRHLMIKLMIEDDYAAIFSKRPHKIDGVSIKFLKWTPDFNFHAEPPYAPVWIRLPGLKLHLYNKQVLFSIATAFGKPLKLDSPTFSLSRPSMARILVEMDITANLENEIWIGSNTNGYWQPVDIEFRPYYCTYCRMFGHPTDRCFHAHPEPKQTDSANTMQMVVTDSLDMEISIGPQHRVQPRIPAASEFSAATEIPDAVIPSIKSVIPTPAGSNNHSIHFPDSVIRQHETGTLVRAEVDIPAAANLNNAAKSPVNCDNMDPNMQIPVDRNENSTEMQIPSSKKVMCSGRGLEAQPNSVHSNPVTGTSAPATGSSAPTPALSIAHLESAIPNTTDPSTVFKCPPVPKFNDASTKLINQQTEELDANSKKHGADFSAVMDKEFSTSYLAAATGVSALSAASTSTLTKHAPVYNMRPDFHSDLNSEQGNTDSDSYETYTGSYIEEDLQLNDACKEVLEEWQAEWEYQKSKKKQKGIRELKGLRIHVGNSRKELGSRRSLSGHL